MKHRRWIPWVVILGMLVFSVAIFNRLPDMIPMRWSLSGEVMSQQPRLIGAFALPGFSILFLLARAVLRRIDPHRGNYHQFESTYSRYIIAVVVGIGFIHILLLGSTIGWAIPVPQVILLGSSVVLLLVANEARRIERNWFLGIRTPWTLSDPDVWRVTHVVAGRLLFGTALVIMLLGLVLPNITGILMSLLLIAAITGYLVYYSYREYQKRHVRA